VSDTVVSNLVAAVIAAASLWWGVGGRDRRALAAIRERLELIELLPVDDDPRQRRRNTRYLRYRLVRETEARAAAYLGVSPGLFDAIYAAGVLIGAGLGLWYASRYGHPRLQLAAYGGVAGGVFGGTLVTARAWVAIRGMRRDEARAAR
jgi:hypothetical protein